MESLKLYNMSEGVTEEDVKNFVKGVDSNGDDKIDYEEYMQWMMGGKK